MRRNYNNTAVPVALTADVAVGAVSIPVAATAGFPPTPFTIGIERGTPNEEVCLVTAVPDATHLTVTRGFDGTTAKSHPSDMPVEHCVIAMDYDEANAHINNDALHQGAPSGAVIDWPGAEAAIPNGWLICDGRAVARATYPVLHGILRDAGGAATYIWGAGDGANTFNLPDCRSRGRIGADNMGGSAALRLGTAHIGSVGGVATVQLATSELATHGHSQVPHTHVENAHNHPQNQHRHTVTGPFGANLLSGFFGDAGLVGGPGGVLGVIPTTTYEVATNQAATASIQNATATNNLTGGNQPHQNMPPYATMTTIIKY